jgi:hypothetical protein
MKRFLIFFAVCTISIHSYSQAQDLDFSIREIYALFGKPVDTVKAYLNTRGYFWTSKEEGFNIYKNDNRIVHVCFKHTLMSLFSFTTYIRDLNLIRGNLAANNFEEVSTYLPANDGSFIASFHNSDGLHQCTLIRSSFSLNVMQVNFGLR